MSKSRTARVDSVSDPKIADPVAAPSAASPAKAEASTPENTRPQILAAAAEEFAAKGLAGARVDSIAKASGCNKGMLYYFFRSKEELYIEVLENAYEHMRVCERELDLAHLKPVDAIRKLVEFKFDYLERHPLLIRLLISENLNDACYLKRSKRLRSMQLPLVDTISELLKDGVAEGTMRPDIDPVQLYISISALSYFYFSNAATLATAFEHDLQSPAAKILRRQHAVDVVLRYLLIDP